VYFFFFLIYVGCLGQLTRTTTIPHGPLDILQAQEQVRHRGSDRRTYRGSNPEQERNKSHELTTTVKPSNARYTQELEPGHSGKAKPAKATDLQAPCVRCVFSVDEMRPIDVVCPSLIKKWFKILCVCVCVCDGCFKSQNSKKGFWKVSSKVHEQSAVLLIYLIIMSCLLLTKQ